MTEVIKRGGKRQRFVAGKIKRSIKNAARLANLPGTKIRDLMKTTAEPVIEFCKKKKIIKSSEIEKLILEKLRKTAKSVIPSWDRFQRKKREAEKKLRASL